MRVCITCDRFFTPDSERPRHRCPDCLPTLARKVEPAVAATCKPCGATFERRASSSRLWCSQRCKDHIRDVPCSRCARPVMWSSTLSSSPVCRPCRRENPKRPPAPPVQLWLCKGCGIEGSRPTVRGPLPKWCRDCQPKRPSIRPTVRRAVYERDQWTCGICNESVDAGLIGSRSVWRPSLDHIVPHTDGGTDEPENLRLAHFWCNSVRGAATYEDEVFRAA